MIPERDQGNDFGPHDRDESLAALALRGPLVVVEVVAAAVAVVGMFEAATEPFGWGAALQFLLCAALGGLLWRADGTLPDDEPGYARQPAAVERR